MIELTVFKPQGGSIHQHFLTYIRRFIKFFLTVINGDHLLAINSTDHAFPATADI